MKNKQAILIIAHNNFWTLEQILKTLDSKYFDFYVHIDKKSKLNLTTNLQAVCKQSHVEIYQEIDVRWADYSQVECELFLLKKALVNKYNYYHLISGNDFPIKSPQKIFEFFDQNSGKEFIHFEGKELRRDKIDWIKYYHFLGRISRNSKIIKIIDKISIVFQKLVGINRLRNVKYKFVTGANWFSITNEFAEYVINNEMLLRRNLQYTRSADEFFLQTLIYNSKFINNLYDLSFSNNYDSCMRFVDWKRGNPYTFKIEDYEALASSNCMFARKFDEQKDKEIIEKIKKELLESSNE